jgi:hypothetical protein
MGAAENVATVRRGYEAFNKGDLKALNDLFDARASWHTPGRASIAGDYKGRDATFAYFGELGQGTSGTFQAKLDRVFAADDGRVVGVHHTIADRNGKHLDVECCLLFEFKNGKIADGREHFEDLYAWDEFWS